MLKSEDEYTSFLMNVLPVYSIFEVEGDLFRVINDKNLFQFLLLYNVIFPPPFIDFFEKDQIFIILEFEFGGADLENSNGKVSNC